MSLESNLAAMERTREAYWLAYPGTSPIKLRWRALNVRHAFHVLPGESILEIGAGSGLWTGHLNSVLRGQNPITAAYFNDEFAPSEAPENVKFQKIENLTRDLPAESFDYVVGTAILCHDAYDHNLRAIYRLLKPGGQILFFEPNYWNPQVAVKNSISWIGRLAGQAECQIGMRKYRLMKIASQQGFTEIDILPYDIIHPLTPRPLVHALQSGAFVLEHAPLVREMCGTLSIWARKPGSQKRPFVNLAEHASLFKSVSFVVPCHNEEMNVPKLVDTLIGFYGPYVHEIVIVNDNSKDRTSEVTREIMEREPRVKLIDRKPPNGVGRALRDGYAAATGRYILTMDSDFVHIVPEFRDLFDAIALEGHAGAIGSRFTHESLMINYPFMKILCNRGFHLLANLLVPQNFHDISNNLKLYRADILKSLELEEPHFAANVETGLKPLLAGHSIKEVPISWINRTIDMGCSSFDVAKVAPNYFGALMRIVSKCVLRRKAPAPDAHEVQSA